MQSVVERIVGRKPDVLAVLVTPWGSQDDVSVRVLLLPERSGEVDELARELRRAGFTVAAALDQQEAHQEFALLFGARPDLVQSVEADDLPASIYLEAATPREKARIEAGVKDDPRVREIVPGDPLSSSVAPVLYEIVDGRLDRLERLLPADRAADVQTLRSLAARVRQPDRSQSEAAVKAAVAVRQLEEFAASRCGLDDGRD